MFPNQAVEITPESKKFNASNRQFISEHVGSSDLSTRLPLFTNTND
jgi:hypothetical protein